MRIVDDVHAGILWAFVGMGSVLGCVGLCVLQALWKGMIVFMGKNVMLYYYTTRRALRRVNTTTNDHSSSSDPTPE